MWALSATSLVTDVSAEMVTSILPLYLVLSLGFSPLAFGIVEGLYPGVTTLVRWASGMAGDRAARHKPLALAGYALSAATRLGWLVTGASLAAAATLVTVDRLGKGIRTAPRDALISLSTPAPMLGRAFGLHRAMDAAGALGGPLVAFAILAAMPGRFDVVFVASLGAAVIGLAVLAGVREPRGAATGSGRECRHSSDRPWRRARCADPGRGDAALGPHRVGRAVYLALQQGGQVPAAWLPCCLPARAPSTCCWRRRSACWPIAGRGPRVRRRHVALALAYAVLLMPLPRPLGGAVVLALLGTYYAATDGVLAALTTATLPQGPAAPGWAWWPPRPAWVGSSPP